MPLENTRRREFSQLVPDHILGEVNGDKFLPIVHRDRVANHLGCDRRAPRPRLMNLLLVFRVHREDCFHEMVVDERSLL